MKLAKSIVSLVAATLLFTACTNPKSTQNTTAQTDSLIYELHERDQKVRLELMLCNVLSLPSNVQN